MSTTIMPVFFRTLHKSYHKNGGCLDRKEIKIGI